MLGARIPPLWMAQFRILAAERGCKPAELAREAFARYLEQSGISTDITDITQTRNFQARGDVIEARIGDSSDIKVISPRLQFLEDQVYALVEQVAADSEKSQLVGAKPKVANTTTARRLAAAGDSWLTTGEAYDQAKRRGLKQSQGTFRRWLRDALADQQLPPTLQSLGLEADWATRISSNPKDNGVRWLRFQQQQSTSVISDQ